MERREAIAAGGLVLIAGCSSSTPETDSDTNTTGQSESTQSQASVSVGEITAPESAEQGRDIAVSFPVNSSTNGTATVTLTNATGSQVFSNSVAVDSDTKQIVVNVPLTSDTPPGNSTISVTVEGGGVSDQATKPLTIVEFIPEWRELFNEAVNKTEQSLDQFSGVGSDAGDRTVLATTTSSGYGIAGTSTLSDADSIAFDAFDETDSGMSAARQQIGRLRDEIQMLEDLYPLQNLVCELYSSLDGMLDSRRGVDEFETSVSEARTQHDDVSAIVSNLDAVVGEVYDDKMVQLDSEITACNDLIEPITDFRNAQDSFEDNSYGAAANEARLAETGFASVLDDIDSPTAYPPTDTVDESFVSLIEEWENEAIDLQRRASEQQSDSGY